VWQKPMNAERPRIECALQDDERLLAGVRAVVRHSAEHAGLSTQTQEELASAALQVCREGFAEARKGGHGDAALRLIVGGTSDHIEITIEYPGAIAGSSANGRESVCIATRWRERFAGVDRMSCDSSGGHSRVTLVKHCDALNSRSAD